MAPIAAAQRPTAAASKDLVVGRAVPKPPVPGTATAGAQALPGSAAKLGAATTVDLSAAAKAKLAELVGGTPSPSIATGIKSLDDVAQERSKALADKLVARLKNLGIELDSPINLKLDSMGNVTTDGAYKKTIDKMFKDDPDLAKEFKEVASLNAMRAAQKALEAFEKETKAAKDDDGRAAAHGRYAARLIASQDVSGTMTLDDGKLRSWSAEYIDASVGEARAAKASTRAAEAATRIPRPA